MVSLSDHGELYQELLMEYLSWGTGVPEWLHAWLWLVFFRFAGPESLEYQKEKDDCADVKNQLGDIFHLPGAGEGEPQQTGQDGDDRHEITRR
jgi:hypothetical protein